MSLVRAVLSFVVVASCHRMRGRQCPGKRVGRRGTRVRWRRGHPPYGIGHDGEPRPGLGRELQDREARRVGANCRRRFRRWDRRPDRRHPGHRRLQPEDGASRNRSRHQVGGQCAAGVRGRARRPGGVRQRQQPVEGDCPRRAGRDLRGRRQADQVVAVGMPKRRLLLRRDPAHRPAEQLRTYAYFREAVLGRTGSSSWARWTRAAQRTWSRW